ncbi:homeobox protein 6-like [Cyclopterus lumpus]|uniref:homeobox protein 6-like n=1 Tax=Cyclopterus lumpus TaxID=8103 RepID=UPI001487540F|nr:homeobox protein 6-like [Cyclopterus lumpus]XP_034385890.1 homeobox protein 6-like [Cyclopterus lumpus]
MSLHRGFGKENQSSRGNVSSRPAQPDSYWPVVAESGVIEWVKHGGYSSNEEVLEDTQKAKSTRPRALKPECERAAGGGGKAACKRSNSSVTTQCRQVLGEKRGGSHVLEDDLHTDKRARRTLTGDTAYKLPETPRTREINRAVEALGREVFVTPHCEEEEEEEDLCLPASQVSRPLDANEAETVGAVNGLRTPVAAEQISRDPRRRGVKVLVYPGDAYTQFSLSSQNSDTSEHSHVTPRATTSASYTILGGVKDHTPSYTWVNNQEDSRELAPSGIQSKKKRLLKTVCHLKNSAESLDNNTKKAPRTPKKKQKKQQQKKQKKKQQTTSLPGKEFTNNINNNNTTNNNNINNSNNNNNNNNKENVPADTQDCAGAPAESIVWGANAVLGDSLQLFPDHPSGNGFQELALPQDAYVNLNDIQTPVEAVPLECNSQLEDLHTLIDNWQAPENWAPYDITTEGDRARDTTTTTGSCMCGGVNTEVTTLRSEVGALREMLAKFVSDQAITELSIQVGALRDMLAKFASDQTNTDLNIRKVLDDQARVTDTLLTMLIRRVDGL